MSDSAIDPYAQRLADADVVWALVRQEFERASRSFPQFNSAHEGYAVLLEEFEEMWDDIKANRLATARLEAIQVAAMAIRYLVDLPK